MPLNVDPTVALFGQQAALGQQGLGRAMRQTPDILSHGFDRISASNLKAMELQAKLRAQKAEMDAKAFEQLANSISRAGETMLGAQLEREKMETQKEVAKIRAGDPSEITETENANMAEGQNAVVTINNEIREIERRIKAGELPQGVNEADAQQQIADLKEQRQSVFDRTFGTLRSPAAQTHWIGRGEFWNVRAKTGQAAKAVTGPATTTTDVSSVSDSEGGFLNAVGKATLKSPGVQGIIGRATAPDTEERDPLAAIPLNQELANRLLAEAGLTPSPQMPQQGTNVPAAVSTPAGPQGFTQALGSITDPSQLPGSQRGLSESREEWQRRQEEERRAKQLQELALLGKFLQNYQTGLQPGYPG